MCLFTCGNSNCLSSRRLKTGNWQLATAVILETRRSIGQWSSTQLFATSEEETWRKARLSSDNSGICPLSGTSCQRRTLRRKVRLPLSTLPGARIGQRQWQLAVDAPGGLERGRKELVPPRSTTSEGKKRAKGSHGRLYQHRLKERTRRKQTDLTSRLISQAINSCSASTTLKPLSSTFHNPTAFHPTLSKSDSSSTKPLPTSGSSAAYVSSFITV